MTLSQKRLLQLFAFLAAWAIVVVARLVQIQLVRHADYVARAQRQQERTIELAPVRGAIRDARGRILAESVAAESIYADPQAIVRLIEQGAPRLDAFIEPDNPDLSVQHRL